MARHLLRIDSQRFIIEEEVDRNRPALQSLPLLSHSAPATAGAGRSAARNAYYDDRIDFFRGLALIFIFVNHIPDNALSYFTSRTVTLFDSAEVFMFLAGYSAALAYYGLVPHGIQPMARKALIRVRSMMVYHLVLVAFVMGTASMIPDLFGVRTGYEVFIEQIQEHPLQTIIATPLLAFQAPLLDILPMYMIVMLLAPYLIWLRAQGEFALLVVSGFLWMFASRFFPAIPTVTPDVVWNFNPFCWQFLFAIGLIFGWRTRTGAQPVAVGSARHILDICAALFVVFSALVLMTIAFQSFDYAAANRLRAMYFSLNKQCLDLWRLVGLLATAYFIVRVVPRDAGWIKSRLARWTCAAGAASLPIFSLSVVLSYLGKFITAAFDGSIYADIAVTFTGVAIMLAVALAIRASKLEGIASALHKLAHDRALKIRAPFAH